MGKHMQGKLSKMEDNLVYPLSQNDLPGKSKKFIWLPEWKW